MTRNYHSDYLGAATHPPCEHNDGIPCEPCNEMTELEAQIYSRVKDLHERHRQARVTRNHVHSPLIHRFPLEIVSYIFTLAFPPRDTPPCCDQDPFLFLPSHSHLAKRPSPLILARVCHTWRVFALSTPRLWSNISVDAQDPKLPFLVYQVAHSGTMPLSIHLFSKSALQDVTDAEQAMSIVIKELHRTASFYLDIKGQLMSLFNSVSDLDHPKATPLLDELHVHILGNPAALARNLQIRLAIEPPHPQRVHLQGISLNHVYLDRANISTLKLVSCRFDLRELLASTHLKQLNVVDGPYEGLTVPSEQEIIVNQSINDLRFLLSGSYQEFILSKSSFPSLQRIDMNVDEMHVACTLLSDFLRRSSCPLQILNICSWDGWNTRAFRAFTDVLKLSKTLQRVTLNLPEAEAHSFSSFDSLIKRLSSRNQDFLPCLQSFTLRIYFFPRYDYLLNLIERSSMKTVASPPEFVLEVPMSFDEDFTIPPDDLSRILRMRAAGKRISIFCLGAARSVEPVDLVEYSKITLGLISENDTEYL